MRQYAALQDKTLFISAGHSERDPGAVAHGHTEAAIVLEFRDLLADYLAARVIADRDGEPGENLSLRDAVGAAKGHDLAVEFHCNAAGSPAATGVETLSAHHHQLGEALCQAIAYALGIDNRGPKDEASGQHSRLAYISQGGGILVELFFLTNKQDLAKYIANRRRCVEAVGDILISAVCAPALERRA